MNTVYLIAFGGGLALAVYAMLHGVEKNRDAGVTRPAPYLNLPAFSALLVAFGAAGYLLDRNSNFSTLVVPVLALISGALGWVGMSILMAKWALRPISSAHDEAEEIQGQPAIVIDAISSSAGSIRYGPAHALHDARARSIDGGPLDSGTEVVIDRFENGVAIVENWAAVEKRL